MNLEKSKSLSEKIAIFISAYILCILWAFLFDFSIKIMGYPYEIEGGHYESYIHFVFYSFIFAPLWEELAFRYAPLEIAKKLGKDTILPMMILSSAIFGWGHYNNPESVLLQGMLGFIFSYVYLKNGLLWSMLLHSIYNISVTFF
jgi:membrane protease YdiL (CAAX protease family)